MSCPVETFAALDELSFVRAAFIQRCPDIDVKVERDVAMARLWSAHRETADAVGFAGMPFVTAQQVHGSLVTQVDETQAEPVPATDGLVTNRKGLCLAIYVADCAAVYLVDRKQKAIGLVHSGKKGTEANIVGAALARMNEAYGTKAEDVVVQIAPCIRPPHYEIDFAADIVRSARAAGVTEVFDCGTCTASDPKRYYSYRREMGKTGRLLALLALV